jgi:uncharacterized protein (TIGR00725 family)
MAHRPYVAVIGPGEADADTERRAEEVGRVLGESGAVVVCGGLGGVMEAACRGARRAARAGGPGQPVTVGILPGLDRSAANEWVDVAIPTGLGEARNALVVRAADAVVAIAGEFGTLSELALALKTGTPVVGLGTWQLAKDGEPVIAFIEATTADEAARLALDLTAGS